MSTKKEKKDNLSKELEALAQNPIKETEAGQIEGGFAEAAQSEEASSSPSFDLNIACA